MKYRLLIVALFTLYAVQSQAQITLVKDINGGGSSSPAQLLEFNGNIVFVANDGTNGFEPWISDGTSEGTTILKNIATGGNTSQTSNMKVVGSNLFFRSNSGTGGKELYLSDGTTVGTDILKDINSSGDSNPNDLTSYNGNLIFRATDGTNGNELWISDGTSVGTTMVADIQSGSGSSNAGLFIEYDGLIYFRADDGSGRELWVTDGTSVNTEIVQDGIIDVHILAVSNDILYFRGSNGSDGKELYKYDGVSVTRVADINSGAGDGTPANAIDFNGSLIFSADDGTNGTELWISDGTEVGTTMVADINTGGSSSPSNFIVMNNKVYFTADDGTNGIELWKTDGTEAGTSMVLNINGSGDSNPAYFTVIDDFIYFSATDGINGIELWRSDGSSYGTDMVEDLNSGASSSSPSYIINVSGTLYFQADNGTNGAELFSYTPPAFTPSSDIVFSNVTSSSMTLTWTAGSGTRHMVVAYDQAPINRTPVDGIEYSFGSTYYSGQNIGGGNRVVYIGENNTFNLSGLGTDVTYYYRIFEVFGEDSDVDYITGQYVDGSQTTLAAGEPTIPASNLVISSVTGSSMTLTWTNGDGSNRIVLARATYDVDRGPIDGTTYTASSSFGSAQNIGGGNKVIYNSTGNSVNLTGLTAGLTYYFRVYEYNGSGSQTNYLTSSFVAGSQTASASAEPTIAASSMNFSNVGPTSMDVSWTNGNGAGRVVVAMINEPVSRFPVDGTDYVANNNYYLGQNIGGGNRVVYKGTSNSFTLTGLTANATYHFRVYEYNGSGGTINYLTSSYPTGSQVATVSSGEPTVAASNINFNSTTANSMNISWTNGNGSGRLVVALKGSPVYLGSTDGLQYIANSNYPEGQNIGGGNKVVYNGTGNGFTMTGLDASTTYHFRVYEYNGSGSDINYLTSSFAIGSNTTSAALALKSSPIAREGNSDESMVINTYPEVVFSAFDIQVKPNYDGNNLIEFYDGSGRLLYSQYSENVDDWITFDKNRLNGENLLLIRVTNIKGVYARKYYVHY